MEMGMGVEMGIMGMEMGMGMEMVIVIVRMAVETLPAS